LARSAGTRVRFPESCLMRWPASRTMGDISGQGTPPNNPVWHLIDYSNIVIQRLSVQAETCMVRVNCCPRNSCVRSFEYSRSAVFDITTQPHRSLLRIDYGGSANLDRSIKAKKTGYWCVFHRKKSSSSESVKSTLSSSILQCCP
jgi:hypothetical protein